MSQLQDWTDRINAVIAAGPFDASWESLRAYRIPKWYQDAKFGIFIHWGIYAVPAFQSEWYPRNMYLKGSEQYEHHLKTYGPQSKFGYKDFIPKFKAEHFDPAAWAKLFAEAGATFVMPVAEHHDGFAMYHTALNRWNARQMGPCRDVVGELADAVRKAGMVFTASSHRAEHWWFFDEGRKIDSDVNDPAFEDLYGPAQPHPPEHHVVDSPERPDEHFLEDWLARTCELVDLHRPQIVWFDWWIQHLAFKPYLARFAAYYYNRAAEWGIGVAINYKYEAFDEGTAVLDIERGQLNTIRTELWQNDTSVSKTSWGYVVNQDYKSPTSIIHDLIDVVSKNGALLLNIGPRPDGTIPEEEQQMLREIGRWLSANGEGIYGTRPWNVYGEGPTVVPAGAFSDTKREAFTSADIRYTAAAGAVYAFVLAKPADDTVKLTAFATLAGDVQQITTLDSSRPLTFEVSTGGILVTLPSDLTFEHAIGLKLVLRQ